MTKKAKCLLNVVLIDKKLYLFMPFVLNGSDFMGYGLEDKKRKNKEGLMKDKDYITEAYLQGGKAIGNIIKQKKKK